MQCQATNRTGTPCLNQAIDAAGYCRTHHPQASQRPSTGGDFEEHVLKVLRLLGYKVERNVHVNGSQIDVYGEFRTGVITLKLMVECKDYGDGKTVGIEEINKFAGVLAVARNTGAVDKGSRHHRATIVIMPQSHPAVQQGAGADRLRGATFDLLGRALSHVLSHHAWPAAAQLER